MTYYPVTKQITDLLQQEGCWFEVFEHEPVLTSEDAAKTRIGYSLHQGAKAMIIKAKGSSFGEKFVMLVLPGDLRFDGDKVKKVLCAKDIRFATEAEIDQLTGGVKIGGVTPFGNLFKLELFVDPILLENEKIVFNAGDRSFSVAMLASDYKKLVNPKIESIT